ncbi:MAG: hypothetical protein QME05_04140 [Candidatus Margulisbacteria bacterium]|nr:hypothetical protein [Candidatus Margulisiibacteriota bacterium]
MIRNFKSVLGEIVLLPDERWEHIQQRHPEANKYSNYIREVLASPDLVKISKKDINVHLYYKFYPDIHGGKYLLIITSSLKKKVVTMFITDRIKVGEVLWQKK